MADCCTNAACEIDKLREGQRSTLRAVLGINIAMFAIEITAGLLAGSTALLADSLDMLGDAARTCGAHHRSPQADSGMRHGSRR